MQYRYIMIGGALNGRIYNLTHDRGREFRLPPSDREMAAWQQRRADWQKDAGGWASPAHAPAPPADVVYNALIIDVEQGDGDVNDPMNLIEIRHCVPESWGTDPETVAKHMIRYFSRMNNAVSDMVQNAAMITPELMRVGKYVGIFHK